MLAIDFGDDLEERIHVAVGDIEQDVLLVAIIMVEQGLGHPAGARQRRHGRAGIAAGGKQLRGGTEDAGALEVEGGARGLAIFKSTPQHRGRERQRHGEDPEKTPEDPRDPE